MSAATGTVPAPGFADPARDAQRTFRALLDALAHPGSRHPVTGPAAAPAALGPALAAVALTVLDEDCAVWLHAALAADAEVTTWIAFHTGARLVTDVAAADFVVATPASRPALADLAVGTDEDPHRSGTLVLDVRGADGDRGFTASGPGIETERRIAAPWADPAFATEWADNGALFPRGVDVVVVDADALTALPRTTRIEED